LFTPAAKIAARARQYTAPGYTKGLLLKKLDFEARSHQSPLTTHEKNPKSEIRNPKQIPMTKE
jgi:hypothetical protein